MLALMSVKRRPSIENERSAVAVKISFRLAMISISACGCEISIRCLYTVEESSIITSMFRKPSHLQISLERLFQRE
uniref:Uncharacterized protein n=1 Tax=Globodera rostochiensis TaxID=31243 RepID=A0A914H7K3_GLORO